MAMRRSQKVLDRYLATNLLPESLGSVNPPAAITTDEVGLVEEDVVERGNGDCGEDQKCYDVSKH